jgi:hypothetical protein
MGRREVPDSVSARTNAITQPTGGPRRNFVANIQCFPLYSAMEPVSGVPPAAPVPAPLMAQL